MNGQKDLKSSLLTQLWVRWRAAGDTRAVPMGWEATTVFPGLQMIFI